jgi:membrane protein YqaA with SNARE-associated domain
MLGLELIGVYGYVGVFLVALAFNLIPFTSPSNLVLAGVIINLFSGMNVVALSFSLAIGASIAKVTHYYVGFFSRRIVNSKSAGRLDRYGRSLGEWGALGAFIAAATSIPDDPVVIPLGLMKYSATKFFLGYFVGKLLICMIGAELGCERRPCLTASLMTRG